MPGLNHSRADRLARALLSDPPTEPAAAILGLAYILQAAGERSSFPVLQAVLGEHVGRAHDVGLALGEVTQPVRLLDASVQQPGCQGLEPLSTDGINLVGQESGRVVGQQPPPLQQAPPVVNVRVESWAADGGQQPRRPCAGGINVYEIEHCRFSRNLSPELAHG